MAKRTLTFNQDQIRCRQARARLQNSRFDRTGGVINAHRIERDALTCNQDSSLTGSDKACRPLTAVGSSQQLQTGTHFSHRHVGSHRKNSPTGQGRRCRLTHAEPLRLLTKIPNPTVGMAASGELRILR